MASSLLILTDFLQASHGALRYAVTLAQALSVRLVLLHVRRDSLLDPALFTSQASSLNEEVAAVALNRLAGNLLVPVATEVAHGRVDFAVAEAISRHHPTLVVLGRSDAASTPDELVEATALDILRTVPYPLLAVPRAVHATHPPRRIWLAADGEEFSLGQHAGAVRHLLSCLDAELTVLHITHQQRAEACTAQALDSVQRTGLTADLAQPVRTCTVVAEEAAPAILQAAHPGKADLLVLIVRPRSFLSRFFHHSVTAQVLLHSDVPVLLLPAAE
ncbi:universal stress protein [Hymenobacter jeollabukensis]|uniref:Universal stress protein n=1 Tax=Hymenobacter jeollabukensis TaxID=2025313 RepID=A0A5R8WIU4_9BACT|nr:universal stress protein [Hymenobacter jeollabukensis]TLM88670.1 universal stress protein [Hymenobacter jeollabukensis]